MPFQNFPADAGCSSHVKAQRNPGLVCPGLAMVLSCSRKELSESILSGYDYFPMEVGQYTIYEVEKTTYSLTESRKVLEMSHFWVYGALIGLLYKEDIQVDFCQEKNCLGLGQITFGTQYHQRIISYGKQ